jgi:hypothetical protein
MVCYEFLIPKYECNMTNPANLMGFYVKSYTAGFAGSERLLLVQIYCRYRYVVIEPKDSSLVPKPVTVHKS